VVVTYSARVRGMPSPGMQGLWDGLPVLRWELSPIMGYRVRSSL